MKNFTSILVVGLLSSLNAMAASYPCEKAYDEKMERIENRFKIIEFDGDSSSIHDAAELLSRSQLPYPQMVADWRQTEYQRLDDRSKDQDYLDYLRRSYNAYGIDGHSRWTIAMVRQEIQADRDAVMTQTPTNYEMDSLVRKLNRAAKRKGHAELSYEDVRVMVKDLSNGEACADGKVMNARQIKRHLRKTISES